LKEAEIGSAEEQPIRNISIQNIRLFENEPFIQERYKYGTVTE